MGENAAPCLLWSEERPGPRLEWDSGPGPRPRGRVQLRGFRPGPGSVRGGSAQPGVRVVTDPHPHGWDARARASWLRGSAVVPGGLTCGPGEGPSWPLVCPPPTRQALPTWSCVAAPRGGAGCCPPLLTAQACEEHQGPTHVPSSAGRPAPWGSVGALRALLWIAGPVPQFPRGGYSGDTAPSGVAGGWPSPPSSAPFWPSVGQSLGGGAPRLSVLPCPRARQTGRPLCFGGQQGTRAARTPSLGRGPRPDPGGGDRSTHDAFGGASVLRLASACDGSGRARRGPAVAGLGRHLPAGGCVLHGGLLSGAERV